MNGKGHFQGAGILAAVLSVLFTAVFSAVLSADFLPSGRALAAEAKRGVVVENGMAVETVRYSDPRDSAYTNAGSDILRFAVYVETDCDTDLDGRPDLVKALVQLPRAAAEGVYLAPVIYEARPYIAGMYLYHPEYLTPGEADLDKSALCGRPPKRPPAGEISTLELAENADPSDWWYVFENDPFQIECLGGLTAYDYFLVRGFAVVQCAGLGTWGSEGVECCTGDPERDAFKSVIEWLTGDRAAYAGLTGDVLVRADWCSGRIAMTGRSYAGAMAFEVASTGVKGLDTVVPVAGPASWYEYANSQGIPSGLYDSYGFIPDLAAMCASRFFADPDEDMTRSYDRYLSRLRDLEIQSAGDFTPFWAAREYSDREGFTSSALIVQGLNDVTVTPRQFDLMRRAFLRSGCEVKVLLHRNGHVTPADEQTKTDILIGEYTFTEWLNRWFCHYLLDADNGVDRLPALTVQSNTDGSFFGAEEWDPERFLRLSPGDERCHTVSAGGARMANASLLSDTFAPDSSGPDRLLWAMDVTEPLTVRGTAEVHIRARLSDTDARMPMLGAVLVDRADEPFPVFDVGWIGVLDREVILEGGVRRGEGVEPYDLVRWTQTLSDRAIVAWGNMDLRDPHAGYGPRSAAPADSETETGAWHDYTLYLQPNYYTVPAGHRLEVYIVPFCGFSNDSAFYDSASPAELADLGFDPDVMIPFTRDYSFTVDNAHSYALIPVAE